MAMTPSERKAAERARRKADGWKRYELWLFPEQWKRLQSYLKRLAKETLDSDRTRSS